jgi:hypothetical protein
MGGAAESLLHFVFHLERDDEKDDANMSCGALFDISDDRLVSSTLDFASFDPHGCCCCRCRRRRRRRCRCCRRSLPWSTLAAEKKLVFPVSGAFRGLVAVLGAQN